MTGGAPAVLRGVRRPLSGAFAALAVAVLNAPLVARAQALAAPPVLVAQAERGEILERLGVASLALKDYAQAVQYLREAIAAGRDRAEVHQSLGFALTALNRCDEALPELETSARQQPAARTFVYMARCYERLRKAGVALYALEQAVPRVNELTPVEQKDLYGSLGYLYAAEGRHAQAADAFQRSLAFGHDPEMAIGLGRAQRLAGDTARARQTLTAIAGQQLPSAVEARRLDELAALDRADGRLSESFAALEKANALEPSAQREYALGLAAGDLARPADAVARLERARAMAPDEPGYAASLGYAYKHAGRLQDAAKTFEAVLARDPDDLPLYEELGYVYAALGDTNRAVEWFKKAIDAQRRIADTAAEREHVVRLQGEVARMSKRFDFAAYLAYRSSSRQPATGTAAPIGGTLPSQSGVELAYQPPMIGFRDERIFQVFGRLLWNFEPGSLELDDDSLQAGVGIRYKPLKTQNLFLSAERLIAIGDAALDDWLLRALYSREYAPVTRPRGSLSNYTTLFGDVGYFVDHSIWALYGEARQGVTWHAASNVLVTPHVVLDARYQDSRGPTDSFVEGGAGVSLRYLFNESQYEGYRSSAELLVQYKAGRFFERSHAGPDDDFHGLVITGVLRF